MITPYVPVRGYSYYAHSSGFFVWLPLIFPPMYMGVNESVSAFIPSDRYYTGDHLWVHFEGPLVRIGITSVAQDALGDVVFVDVPDVGMELKLGAAFSWIESSKAVVDLCAPLSGSVTHTNVALKSTPEALNRDPYGVGWICMFEPQKRGESEVLLDAESYAALVRETE